MPQNPPAETPRITPYLLYHDVASALDWLSKTFGFRESFRMDGPGGKVTHAEMRMEDGLVMLGSPDKEYKNPKELKGVTQFLYVYVDKVDEHFARTKAAGAKILKEPEDQFYGDRSYAAEDPEGHHWYFATHVKDVTPEEMKAHA
jgi:PhnB protein